MWANIWAAISALSSLATFVIALWAMFRWGKQEELKAKQEFKKSVAILSDYLAQLPKVFNDENHIREFSDKLDELTSLYVTAAHAWHGTEGLLEKDKKIMDNWRKIGDFLALYIEGQCERSSIIDPCSEIIISKFVFK